MKKLLRVLKTGLLYIPIILVWGVVAIIVYNTVKVLVMNDNNVYLVKELFYICKPITLKDCNKTVVLRLDDIQANAFTEASKRMIDDAISYRFPLVLGIIPNGLENDKDMVNFIKKRMCDLELAMHGWDHSIMYGQVNVFEFESISKDDAKVRIEKGEAQLKKLFNVSPVTFIPPGNLLSDDVYGVLKDEGIKNVSAANDQPLDMDAYTYDFINNKMIDDEEIISICKNKFQVSDTCVIVMHPQDYMSDGKFDQEKYKQYISLLQKIDEQEWGVARFTDLNN